MSTGSDEESAVAAYSDASSLLLPETPAAAKSDGPRIEIECMGGEGISMAARVLPRVSRRPAGLSKVVYRRQLFAFLSAGRQETAHSSNRCSKHGHLLPKVTTSDTSPLLLMSATIDLRPLSRSSSVGGVADAGGAASDAGASSTSAGGADDSSCLSVWTRLMGFADQPHRFNDQVGICVEST